MKQSIPPAAVAGIVIVVVALLAIIGMKVLAPHREAGASAADMQQRIKEHGGGYNNSMPGSGGQKMGSPSSSSPSSGGSPTSGGSPGSGGSPTSSGG